MASDDPDFDAAPFREWLSRTAESKDTSEDELLHRMMSSYWILDELTDFMSEADFGGGSDEGFDFGDAGSADEAASEASAGGPAASEANTASGNQPLDPSVIELIAALKRPEESSGSGGGQDLVEVINALGEFSQSSREGADDYRFSDLRDELDSVSQAVEDLQATVDDLDARVEDLDGRTAGRVGELSEAVDGLAADLQEVQARLDGTASEEALERLAEHVSGVESDLSRRVSNVESDVEGDFDKVRTVLEHLLERAEEVEEDTTVLFDAYEDLQPLLADYDRRQRVADLRAAANRAGVDTADCEACGEPVDIGLLSRSACPHCDRPFEDLRTDSGWFRTSHVLETGDPGATDHATARREVTDGVLPTLGDLRREHEERLESEDAVARRRSEVDRSAVDRAGEFDWINEESK